MQDRPYQFACHTAIASNFTAGVNHQLVSMATGTGKTVIFAQLPDKLKHVLPGQSIILAHREELIDQSIAKMRQANPSLRIDKEMANHHADPSLADAIVASVATLGRKNNSRILQYNWDNFDKFITDEAHHSTAQSYLNIYEAVGLFTPGDKRLHVGFTATPQRSDGKALAKIYQKIAFNYGMRQAIEEGWLVEPHGIRVNTRISLDQVKVSAGDYAQGELADTVNTPQRNQLIVRSWLDNCRDMSTLAFTVDIQHAKDLAAVFRHYGIKAEAVWGDDPDRAHKLASHRAGDITILCNCGVLTEGYDDPNIQCIILARPTKSSVLFTQMVGRATRLSEGCGNLLTIAADAPWKRACFILDIVDVSSRHSLITLPTLLGMSSGLDLKGEGIVQAIHKLEDAQKNYPHIDFTQLGDITQLTSHIESVNLFDIKFPAEVESNSEMSWHPSPSGGYILLLPNRESLRIQQNLLDNWEISGIINSQRYRGERGSMEEAFHAADTLIQNNCQESLNILRRTAAWHSQEATPAQLKLLTKLFRGKPLPFDLDKGMASRLIGSALAGKAA